jgi:hypothetical protein
MKDCAFIRVSPSAPFAIKGKQTYVGFPFFFICHPAQTLQHRSPHGGGTAAPVFPSLYRQAAQARITSQQRPVTLYFYSI